MIKALMRAKVEDAIASLALVRDRGKVREAYLTRRWGHNAEVMSAFKVICQEQVQEVSDMEVTSAQTKATTAERVQASMVNFPLTAPIFIFP